MASDLHLGWTPCGKKYRKCETCSLATRCGFRNHDEELQMRWNKKVTKHDVVWILGDLAQNKISIRNILSFNGIKHLVLGNHDIYNMKEYVLYFKKIRGSHYFKKKYWFSHISFHPKALNYYNASANIHGHFHGGPSGIYMMQDKAYMNICYDFTNYEPIAIEEIDLQMEIYKQVDKQLKRIL